MGFGILICTSPDLQVNRAGLILLAMVFALLLFMLPVQFCLLLKGPALRKSEFSSWEKWMALCIKAEKFSLLSSRLRTGHCLWPYFFDKPENSS